MAGEAGEADQDAGGGDDEIPISQGNGQTKEKETEDKDEGSEEDEEEEPRLKYASLTKHLKSVYRNGDATSAFLVAGDKMVSINNPKKPNP